MRIPAPGRCAAASPAARRLPSAPTALAPKCIGYFLTDPYATKTLSSFSPDGLLDLVADAFGSGPGGRKPIQRLFVFSGLIVLLGF
jgi:hypothetical protein